MGFCVRRLARGETWQQQRSGEETVYVFLAGKCTEEWDGQKQQIGERNSVFDGLPYALYASPGTQVRFESLTTCEIAECNVPSQGNFTSRLVTPKDVVVSLRGGGNASRQIVEIMQPDFPADRLIVVEVYTPCGNWSSYPPHKHDVHNPPAEVDLHEIYYYRMNRPGAFGHQRLYSSDGQPDTVVTVHGGAPSLVHERYHPTVAVPAYYT